MPPLAETPLQVGIIVLRTVVSMVVGMTYVSRLGDSYTCPEDWRSGFHVMLYSSCFGKELEGCGILTNRLATCLVRQCRAQKMRTLL